MTPILSGLLLGAAFGAILFASGLADPRRIVGMLRLKDLFLLKALVTALGVGIVGVALLAAAGQAHTSVKTLHVLAVALGGVVFGAGFALTGYCPGTSLAAAAAGRRDAWFVVLGGLSGTAAFAALYPAIAPLLIEPLTFGKPTVDSAIGVPALAVALPIGAAVAYVVLRWRRSEHPTPTSKLGAAAPRGR